MTIGKAKIVDELAGSALLLPDLVAAALAANARIKFALSWLQTVDAVGGDGAAAFADLAPERALAGLGDDPLYAVPVAVKRGTDGLSFPNAGAVLARLLDDLVRMRAATEAGAEAGVLDPLLPAQFRAREAAIAGGLPRDGDTLPPGLISALSQPPRDGHDSLHGLVMDMHRALNTIAAGLAEADIAGARVYHLKEADKDRVRAFMRGLNRTAPLKFNHPGLAANAMRDGTRLVIQNDIGTTDAHVLIAYVAGLRLSVTYSDIHRQRLEFFERRLKDFSWTLSNRHVADMEEDFFHLATGTYDAADLPSLDAALEWLGASIVFLIDWNKARKNLRRLVSGSDAIAILEWAADHGVGHRAYLEIGGDRVVADLLEAASKATGGFYVSLQSALGEDGAIDFLHEMLRIASEQLRQGRSALAIRDLLRAELLARVASIADRILNIAVDHAALTLDLANLVRRVLLERHAATQGVARRANAWEALADRQVVRIRDLCRNDDERVWQAIASSADDATDDFEETAFRLQFLAVRLPDDIHDSLLQLADHAVAAVKDYVRLLCALRDLHRGAPPQDMRAFLEIVERLHDHEHRTDEAEREVFSRLMGADVDAKLLRVVDTIATGLEEAADALLRTGRLISDHALGGWFAA